MTPSTSTRIRFVLLLSLALNLMLGTALGLIWWHHGDQPHRGGFGGMVRMPQMQILERVLPSADHAALHAAYARHRPSVHQHFTAVRDSKNAVREALNAEPFDRAVLEQALTGMRGDEQGVAAAVHALLVEVASTISPAGRRSLAQIVTSRRLWHGGERHHERRPESRPKAESKAPEAPAQPGG